VHLLQYDRRVLHLLLSSAERKVQATLLLIKGTLLIFKKFAQAEETLNAAGTSQIDTNDFTHINMPSIFQNPVPIYFSFTSILPKI
jgi:hypothetical protein